MKIDRIETFVTHVGRRNLVFVKVSTDQGLHGIGEAYSVGPDLATVAAIEDLASWIAARIRAELSTCGR